VATRTFNFRRAYAWGGHGIEVTLYRTHQDFGGCIGHSAVVAVTLDHSILSGLPGGWPVYPGMATVYDP
jgi:hypothetical protein